MSECLQWPYWGDLQSQVQQAPVRHEKCERPAQHLSEPVHLGIKERKYTIQDRLENLNKSEGIQPCHKEM